MAILSLSNNLTELKQRIANIVVACSRHTPPRPVTCDDLGLTGAVTALLKDAIKPTLIQTLEGTPVFVHCGPFANIAHGNSSVIADKIGLELVGPDGFVLTECGFGADIGLEKFLNIKCRASGLAPDVVVIVATVRALKNHGGGPPVTPGAVLPKEYREEVGFFDLRETCFEVFDSFSAFKNLELVRAGLDNLRVQIENITHEFGLKVVVAINRFFTDTDAELELIRAGSLKFGATDACVSRHWEFGGAGAVDLAKAIIKASEGQPPNGTVQKNHVGYKHIYDDGDSIKVKIEKIATKIYRAKNVDFSEQAEKRIEVTLIVDFKESCE